MAEVDKALFTVTLPMPPSVNHAWINSGRRRIRSTEYLQFCKKVYAIVSNRLLELGYKSKVVCRGASGETRVVWDLGCEYFDLEIYTFYNSFVSYDVDNRIKPVLDALERTGVYDNDNRVLCVTAVKGCPIEAREGCCVVSVYPAQEQEDPVHYGLNKLCKKTKGRRSKRWNAQGTGG